MKQGKAITLVLSALLSIFAVSAHANTVTPSKDSAVTIDSNGQHKSVTSETSIQKGDRVTAHNGSATLSYGSCEQTLEKEHYVVITTGNTCGSMKPLDGAGQASKVARIDSNTAGLPCTSCKAALAKKIALGKLAAVGGLAIAAAVIADNRKSSPD